MEITIRLPYPPSVNHIWRTILVKGRQRTLISKKGREYRDAVRSHCLIEKIAGIGLKSRLRVTMSVYPPDRRRRDLDNVQKCIFDAITHAGVWGDDSQIDEIRIWRGKTYENSCVVVGIEELDG